MWSDASSSCGVFWRGGMWVAISGACSSADTALFVMGLGFCILRCPVVRRAV
jgi:hypothetical protein